MIDYEQYPADFDTEQERALDALAEIYNADDIPEEALEAVRARRFTLLQNVHTLKDLGLAHAEYTGLDEGLYYLFDWERYGEELQIDGGDFTSYGWIRLD